jgi:hypothetical protein
MLLGGWYAEDGREPGAWLRSQVAGALAQALLVKKGASNLYTKFSTILKYL